ncbi:peptide ABC transporter permease [Sulfolobus acidocaldarius SUSAZ]|nr:peptide ABC transporter permease [Sulfolobus acidocaldarius SUSAZ]
MSQKSRGLSYYLKEFLKIKIGLAGLIILAVLLVFTGIALTVPSNVYNSWFNPAVWSQNPPDVPPSWLSYFSGQYFTTQQITSSNSVSYAGGQYYITELNFSFEWSKSVIPNDVYFIISSNSSPLSMSLYWIKPDGDKIQINVPSGYYNVPFDLIPIKDSIINYISSKSGTVPEKIATYVLVTALFDSAKTNFTAVENGKYNVVVYMVSKSPMNTSNSKITLLGNSYGLMGTDYFGRPLDLGILLGLPNALEIGALTAVISVLIGIIVGGLSGYLGGNKDSVIQWVTLVFLALPALPFLVAVSFVSRPSIELEALLIAFLSWPFYAIIARSVALSIKSNSYVEVDKLLGIPSYRVFFTHFLPRLVPITIAYMALGVPAGVLLEQTLAFLGIAPPGLITWGGMLDDAYTYQAQVNGWWWWVIFPGAMIVIVAVPFVLIGFAIERLSLGER